MKKEKNQIYLSSECITLHISDQSLFKHFTTDGNVFLLITKLKAKESKRVYMISWVNDLIFLPTLFSYSSFQFIKVQGQQEKEVGQ